MPTTFEGGGMRSCHRSISALLPRCTRRHVRRCEGKGPTTCPLDPKITIYVNVIIIWIGFGGCMIAATLAPRNFTFAGALNWGTAVVNGICGHIVPAVITSTYNPGVVQSIQNHTKLFLCLQIPMVKIMQNHFRASKCPWL